MRVRNLWGAALRVTLAVSVAACGGGGEETAGSMESAAETAVGQRVDPQNAGNVMGTVVVNGEVPANAAIQMNADPVCVQENQGPQSQETYVVGGDGTMLGNVFVYVKDGLGDYVFDAPTESVTLDQQGCRYTPHVFGIRVNQPFEIVNSDPTLHNIHATPTMNREFNNGQPIQGMKMTHTFTETEVMVPFKCDVHGWMGAYVGVLDHPYFAVTGPDGTFDLTSLPAGTYTIEAWHERLGASTQSVTVGAMETAEVTFTFDVSAAAASN